jgi:hypothetical protein
MFDQKAPPNTLFWCILPEVFESLDFLPKLGESWVVFSKS